MSSNSTFSSPELFTAHRTNNATPSPSAIPDLPLPDSPDTLTSKEVFLEAVASLSHASEILTAAARAMSSAAKSLALAGAHSDCGNLFLRRNVGSPDEEISQEWLKRSYNLDRAAEDMPGQRTLSPPITELFSGMSLSPPKRPDLPFDHISTSSLPSKKLDVDGILSPKPVSPGIKQSVAQQSTTVSLPQTDSPSSQVSSSSFSEDDHTDSDDGESVPEATIVEMHHQFTQQPDIIPSAYESEADSSSSESSPHPFVRSLNANSDEKSSSEAEESEAEDSDNSDESTQNSPPQISGRYIILEEDFDVIPLVCHIATLKPNENTLCFVKDVKMMQTLQTMIEEIMPKPICMLVPGGPQGPKKAAGRLCESSEGCLIFCSAFSTPLPICIRHKSFHSVIHVGWAKTEELFEEQRDRPDLQRATLILTKEECSEHMLTDEDLRLEGYARCPSTDVYNNLGSHKKLSEIREQWKEQLRNSYGDLCHTFEAWITFHYSGPHKVTRWSATDVATYANTFAKKTLLHGNAKVLPRHPQRPIIGRRLSVTSQFASDLGLEEPVKSKILVVEEFDE